MALRTGAAVVLALVLSSCCAGVGGHTWLTDPPAHYQLFPRNGIVNTPCEPYSSNHKPTRVKAGQEIDVTWGAMGHAGGYVRLSLAPKWWLTFDVPERNDGSGDGNDTIIFSSNVVKYDCFGGGECDTCVTNDRPYGTRMVIPINLKDGIYTLQLWSTGVGQATPQSFSCADLDISGGDESITCDDIAIPDENITQSLDKCWSCAEEFPDALGCRPPHRTEGGFGAKFGKFCYPENPVRKQPQKELIGYVPHELGPGDTLLGIAKTFQCCCTAEEIGVTTGWGDLQTAIVEMQFQTLIAGREVMVPFYGSRRGCTPADPADFLNAAPGRRVGAMWPVVVAVTALAVAAAALLHDL